MFLLYKLYVPYPLKARKITFKLNTSALITMLLN